MRGARRWYIGHLTLAPAGDRGSLVAANGHAIERMLARAEPLTDDEFEPEHRASYASMRERPR